MAENKKKDFSVLIQAFLSLPKTIWFNLRYLPWKEAKKLPILVHYRTKIKAMKKGSIVFPNGATKFMVKIGFGNNPSLLHNKTSVIWITDGKVSFLGKAIFGEGSAIRNKGEIVFGSNFSAMQNCVIWCSNKISFGNECLLGWDVLVRDHDGHLIYHNGEQKPENKPIYIGNHVWLCAEARVLKGVCVQDDSVVGYKSLVTKAFNEKNVIIAGQPAKIVQTNISWER